MASPAAYTKALAAKMKKINFLYLALFFLASCSQESIDRQEEKRLGTLFDLKGKRITETQFLSKETAFTAICDTLINGMKDTMWVGSIRIDTLNNFLYPHDFVTILRALKEYDLNGVAGVVFNQNICNGYQQNIWQVSNGKIGTEQIKRSIYKTKVKKQDYKSSDITLIEYTINRRTKPKMINMLVINNNLEFLVLDKTTYTPHYLIRFQEFRDAVENLEKIKISCK